MNTHDYEITARDKADDPWRRCHTCTDRRDALDWAGLFYRRLKGRSSVCVVSVDRDTRERVIIYRIDADDSAN